MLESLAKLSNILAYMRLLFITSRQQSENNLFECQKVFQIVHIVLPTEQSIKSSTFILQVICLNFKWTFTILKELMNVFWKISQTFPEQPILGVCMTIVLRKISVDLTWTCFSIRGKLYL